MSSNGPNAWDKYAYKRWSDGMSKTYKPPNEVESALSGAILALDRYGVHDNDCGIYGRRRIKTCTCGLEFEKEGLQRAIEQVRGKEGMIDNPN